MTACSKKAGAPVFDRRFRLVSVAFAIMAIVLLLSALAWNSTLLSGRDAIDRQDRTLALISRLSFLQARQLLLFEKRHLALLGLEGHNLGGIHKEIEANQAAMQGLRETAPPQHHANLDFLLSSLKEIDTLMLDSADFHFDGRVVLEIQARRSADQIQKRVLDNVQQWQQSVYNEKENFVRKSGEEKNIGSFIFVITVSTVVIAFLFFAWRQWRILASSIHHLTEGVLDIARGRDVAEEDDASLVELPESRVALRVLQGHVRERQEFEVEIRQKNRELELVNEEIARLSYVSAHHMREPVRRLIAFSRMLKKDGQDSGSQSELLNFIRSDAELISNMVGALNRYARFVTLDKRQEFVSLQTVLDMALRELRAGSDRKCNIVSPAIRTEIRGHRAQMEFLFREILANILKHAYPGGQEVEVEIKSRTGRNYILLAFRDRGCGIDNQYLRRIFRFLELNAESLDGQARVSVGLVICRRIVMNHKGRIKILSRTGTGTTVYVLLPADHGEAKQAPGSIVNPEQLASSCDDAFT